MQDKSNFIRIKRKPFLFTLFVLILAIATPVLADYLGPDRTTTTSEVDTYDYGVWARDNNKVPYCLDNKGNKADDCIVCEWKRKPGNACGDATYSYKLGTKTEVVETTINLPPATISSSLQNCNSNNGWCNTLPTLSLNGSEPLAGYNILAVEGSLDGQTFACSDSTCDVPLNEGNNDFTFWALSSYGDSSEMGDLSAKVDTVSPTLGLDIAATSGSNGWYVSSTSLTATGSDETSGLSSVFLSVDSGAWISSTTLNEGVYNVLVQAEDNAGNITNSTTTISVDTTTPSIDLAVNGTLGSNGWYSSSMQVSATASDVTSGVGSLESSLDGGVYQAYNSPLAFVDGYHTVQFKSLDKAGNETETSVQEFYVDTIAPAIDLPTQWKVNDSITYKVQDDGSGLSALRIVIEDEDEKYKKVAWDEDVSGDKFKGEITWNGRFKNGTIAPPGEYLVWIKAKDKAGNERFGLGRVIVPQPTVFSLLQPTITNNQETLLPPQELFDEDELSNASSATPMAPQISFGGSTTDPKETTQNSLSLAAGTASASTATNSNILWGATAAALIGWATAAALEEKKKRKEREQVKARASRDEEPPMTRQEKELAKQRKELQKIWDANGAAIYEANREYKAKHGKEMDAAARSEAIKDATMNGVFHAGAYASNLEAEKARRDAQKDALQNLGAGDKNIEALKQEAATKRLGAAYHTAEMMHANLQEQKISEILQADMTEEERWEAYQQTPGYVTRQEALADWYKQQETVKPFAGVPASGGMGTLQQPGAIRVLPKPALQEPEDCGFLGYRCWAITKWVTELFSPKTPAIIPTPVLPTPQVFITHAPTNTPILTPIPFNYLGSKAALIANKMLANQNQGLPLPNYFYNFQFPNTHCTEFVSEVQRQTGVPIREISQPNNPVSFRTPINQRYNSELNGEFRFILNPSYHPSSLKDPRHVNNLVYEFYKINPNLFVPGATVYTKSPDLFQVYGSDGKTVIDSYLNDKGVFGHSSIIVEQFGNAGPSILEMSGPYSYNQNNGLYTGNWLDNWNYSWESTPELEHTIIQRSLFENIPTSTLISNNPNGPTTATVLLTELSVVPAQPVLPIDLSNYGLNFELSQNNLITINDIVDQSTGEQITKPCYLNPETANNIIQQIYCPPIGQP